MQEEEREQQEEVAQPAKKPSLVSPIIWLAATVLIAIIGINAYLNDYVMVLFGIIPLNGIVFGIGAIAALAWSVWSLIAVLKARKEHP
ncbi:MAG: hypothetical protein FWD27_02020 [Coriobacteriia bacterium]|nr:hypothetical protein [Coriobacteriia bacterium]